LHLVLYTLIIRYISERIALICVSLAISLLVLQIHHQPNLTIGSSAINRTSTIKKQFAFRSPYQSLTHTPPPRPDRNILRVLDVFTRDMIRTFVHGGGGSEVSFKRTMLDRGWGVQKSVFGRTYLMADPLFGFIYTNKWTYFRKNRDMCKSSKLCVSVYFGYWQQFWLLKLERNEIIQIRFCCILSVLSVYLLSNGPLHLFKLDFVVYYLFCRCTCYLMVRYIIVTDLPCHI